ncbi:MAG TPA: hypothetical protein VFE30_10565 [Anaeromyxobacteraceae bacterium]|jgi:hypothetical protein|nr:hypothetical protein [Anaeromyxobacteraceae bacterium]
MRLLAPLTLVALLAACGPDHPACATGKTLCAATCVDLASDPLNCGTCGNACPAGVACGQGACSIPCQPHQNGLGQTYQDCAPLGSFGPTAALEAAKAWSPQGGRIDVACVGTPANPDCLGWMRGDGTCGIWCYTGTLMGNVYTSTNATCICFASAPGNWN